jgi:hypothetical protein
MYQSLAESTLPFSVQVFTRLDEAYAWLGRPMPKASCAR